MKKPELLIPAGSLEVMKTAIRYGADAVYCGGEEFSLRAKAKNFSDEDLAEGIRYAHEHGVKVHITANILAHNYDFPEVEEFMKKMKELKPDAMIINDPGIFMTARRICPEIDIHISTQSSSTNYETFKFWHDLGATRVVAARELSLEEIRQIRAKVPEDLEIEAFVHGAMCMSYSGRCMLSNFFTGRDANRGECTHPCRWRYSIVEETRPGEYMPVYENERGTYIFNSKDLCMIDYIPELCEAGIDSFKLEGRMKTALYVATIARTYRKAIDDYYEDPEKYRRNLPWYRDEIARCTYREFTTGFYFGKPDTNAQIYDSNTYVKNYTYLGTVRSLEEDGTAVFEQKNKFCVGDVIEIMKPDGTDLTAKVLSIRSDDGEEQDSAPHPLQNLHVKLDQKVEEGDILRVEAAAE
ncbi:peptidase U32 family protein [[Clostridium] aminophilum]|uniref:Putative protease n=1 Tax=[Clostridium] aminophilum TaxID=1526 RepID=A0A1I0D356_9FIRM|nr:U32 family peptidase [[Clostridium] aminophilum]MDD6196824.1 U32 family peptidase [[Clostridium] aminophilum]SET26352.1 putative protease [[Clostridium] aminophilum]